MLRVGDLPTSKPLRQWLAALARRRCRWRSIPRRAWQDPAGAVATLAAADPRAVLDELAERLPRRPRARGWLERWTRPDRAAAGAIAAALGRAGLSEPRVAAELGVRLPPKATLVVALVDAGARRRDVLPVRDAPPRVLANRGANGIDGTVSTAFGVAAAAAGPVVLLLGDVALAHDVGGLLAARRLGLPLVIVLLDNDGGGIFDFLPVAREGAGYEEHVATPHGLDFAHAAALYGLRHERVAAPRAVPRRARRRARARRGDADPRAHGPRGERRAAPRGVGGRPAPPRSVAARWPRSA